MKLDLGLDHLMNPLVGGDLITALLEVFGQSRERREQQSDPNILAYLNNRVNDYNTATAYNPSSGQFNAGSMFGDPQSGYGGAYGSDGAGNPLSPFQANTRYNVGQIANSQNVFDQGLGNLNQAAGVAGLPALGGYDLGTSGLGLDPGAVQGVDQSTRRAPTPMNPVAAPEDDWFNRFLGSFAVGTTSIPQDGIAKVHQGEMIVPRQQNPNALPAGMPGAPMMQPGGAPNAPMPMPMPQGNFQPMQPGLNPQVQQQIVNRGTGSIDQQHLATQRGLRSNPNLSGGVLERQLFDAELARRGQIADMTQDVGIEAANRQFTDTLQGNQFELSRLLGLGGLGLQQGQLAQGQQALDLQGELGRGQLGQGQQSLDLQGEIQRGQLGQGQQSLDLERLLGMGGLDLQRQLGLGQLGQGQQSLDLQGEIQRGQLGQGQQSLDLERLLGLGGLDLQRGGLDLQRELGRGQLGQGQQSLDLERLLGLGGLDVQQGRLGLDQELGRGGLDLQRILGLGNLDLGREGLALDRELGLGGLGVQQGRLGLDQELGRGGLALDRELGLGNLNLQELLGLGNLDVQQGRLGLDQELGRGQLQLGRGDLARNFANDAFGMMAWGEDRNDALSQQDFENRFQETAYSQGQQQYGDLLALLGQYAGQSAAPAATGGGGGGGTTGPGMQFADNLRTGVEDWLGRLFGR